MDYCSYFIRGYALFGRYPSQEDVEELESEGVTHFIDLTCLSEELEEYDNAHSKYIYYPIIDTHIPHDNMENFHKFICKICKIFWTGGKMYIHCKGGHGRSGLVVACILCCLYGCDAETALTKTNKYHSERLIMKEKWRNLGSPQNNTQKDFVREYHKYLLSSNKI
jgi:protein-tyrosine phosphatase